MAKSKKRMLIPEQMDVLRASEFWDEHSLLDFSDTQEVKSVDIHVEREVYYCPVSRGIMQQLQDRARTEGVSAETLVNLYLQEKLAQP